MVPNLSKPGHSFKGALAYHAHDKNTLDSDERVEWHATRGLISDDLDTAERVMIATAYDSDRLKEEAGIKATGRKSAKHVQTFSLAWHPDERVDREEMERAADSALKELGLEDHQAVILSHTDTKHQHVHVVVNRVNPNDGRMATLSNSKRKLDRWAHDYEKDRGHIVTPNRAEKYERQQKARERYPADERRAYAERKRDEAQRSQPANEKAVLARRQRELKGRHGDEWRDLKRRHREQRQEDYQTYRRRWQKTKDQHDQVDRENAGKRRAEWRDLYRQQKEHRNDRERMGRSVTGRLALSITAAREEKEQGAQGNVARLAWANFVSNKRREAVFSKVEERDKAKLAEQQSFARDKAFSHLRDRRAEEISVLREQQAEDRKDLKTRQIREKDELRRDWTIVNNQERQEADDLARETHGHADDIEKQQFESEADEGRQTAEDRLRALRESREVDQSAKDQRSAADRLAEIRRAERDRDQEEKARKDRGRSGPGDDFGL